MFVLNHSLYSRSPTHAGGLFAIDREYFLEIGAYDPGLLVWGGENFELSFKVCSSSYYELSLWIEFELMIIAPLDMTIELGNCWIVEVTCWQENVQLDRIDNILGRQLNLQSILQSNKWKLSELIRYNN